MFHGRPWSGEDLDLVLKIGQLSTILSIPAVFIKEKQNSSTPNSSTAYWLPMFCVMLAAS